VAHPFSRLLTGMGVGVGVGVSVLMQRVEYFKVASVPGWRIHSADYSQVWVWVWVWETTHRCGCGCGCGCGCQCTHAACRILQSALSARVAHPFSRLLTGMGVGVGVGVIVLMQRVEYFKVP